LAHAAFRCAGAGGSPMVMGRLDADGRKQIEDRGLNLGRKRLNSPPSANASARR